MISTPSDARVMALVHSWKRARESIVENDGASGLFPLVLHSLQRASH